MWYKEASSDEQEPMVYIGVWYAVYADDSTELSKICMGYQTSHECPQLCVDITDQVVDEIIDRLEAEDAEMVAVEGDQSQFNLARHEAQTCRRS